MNRTLLGILQQLNTDQYADEATIGKVLNMTRAAVWKNLQQLQNVYGVAIDSSKGIGYRLQQPFTLLDGKALQAALIKHKVRVDCLASVDSTNDYLLRQDEASYKHHVCLAEHQTKGRGRFNRSWLSQFGENILVSFKTILIKNVNELSCLSLVVAVVIVQTLVQLYAGLHVQIKWPNDVYMEGKKLSGNLIEIKAASNFQSQVIIGIGINVNMSDQQQISQPWISLKQVLGQVVDRNPLVSALIKNLIHALELFEKKGFSEFISTYEQYDYLYSKELTLALPYNKQIKGLGSGVNKVGQLMLRTKQGVKNFASGEASLVKELS